MKIERLGPYRILEQIGKGGMGAVYLAAYEGPGNAAGTRVAVKALSPQLAVAEGFRERFEAEIDSLKKLKHEGIVRLFGYGEQDGVLFYSMELVEGTSLEQEINSGHRFDWRETLQIGIQVCRALKHAHDHGVVHRDIKPANLLLTHDFHIKIADFGIARLFGGTQLTTAGGVLGTADYMSPEQADGRPVTEKCDQYSLGGVMYALLAGRPPFRAKTMPEMLQLQRFAEPEPVRRYAPKTPEQLEQLLSQLLRKDPDERFPNVLVLGRHMEAMEKALSRNTTKSATATDLDGHNANQTTAGSEHTASIAPDATSLPEADGDSHSGGASSGLDPALYDAPTLDQSEAAAAPSSATPPARPTGTHFTSIDEEARRLKRLEESESHLALIARWIALLLLLAGMVSIGWRLFRPATADELYQEISETIDNEGTEDLRPIADELAEFLDRFPLDERAEEVAGYADMLELQKTERRAMAKSRFTSASKLGAVESLYLEARSAIESDPARGRRLLRDIIALYDPHNETAEGTESAPGVPSDLSEQDRVWLLLARQQLERAQNEADKIATTQLPILKSRLQAARKMEHSDPASAADMYRAFVHLYHDELWAAELVAQAQSRLQQLSQ